MKFSLKMPFQKFKKLIIFFVRSGFKYYRIFQSWKCQPLGKINLPPFGLFVCLVTSKNDQVIQSGRCFTVVYVVRQEYLRKKCHTFALYPQVVRYYGFGLEVQYLLLSHIRQSWIPVTQVIQKHKIPILINKTEIFSLKRLAGNFKAILYKLFDTIRYYWKELPVKNFDSNLSR